AANEFRRRDGAIQIDAGVEAHACEHVEQILGRHVAGRAWRERAAANAAERAIEHTHTLFYGGDGVSERGVARVVKMRAQLDALRDRGAHGAEARVHIAGRCDADRIGKREFEDILRSTFLSDFDDASDGYLSVEGAAERRGD